MKAEPKKLMKTQVYTFNDNKYGSFHKREDAYEVHDKILCVADGITRDPLHISDFSGIAFEELLRDYPHPSPALKAAEVCCDSFRRAVFNQSDPRTAIIKSNDAIAELNKDLHVDYLVNDYAACVAAGAVIDGLKLQWASIGDCFVAIFDADGNLKFESPHGTEAWAEFESKNPGDWTKPEYRRKVRSQFRNNPEQIIDGKLVAYGALTGEPAAEKFIKSGSEELTEGDMVLCFSDGFLHTMRHPEFYNKVTSRGFGDWQQSLAEKDYAKYGHERTLLIRGV